ncbi:MAG: helix-turn-helix domain-containing protein [Brevundimonas sp.]
MHRLIAHVSSPTEIDCRFGFQHAHALEQQTGDLSFVPAGLPAWWRDREPSQVLIADICPSLFSGHTPPSRRFVFAPALRFRDERILQLLTIADEALKSDETEAAFTDALGAAIASRLARRLGSIPQPGVVLGPSKLRRVCSHIERCLHLPLRLAELACVSGLGRSQFSVAFRRATGVTPHQYVLERRVQRAQHLLITHDATVAEIAVMTGFAHQAHLSRVFRQHTGLTPSRFRASRSPVNDDRATPSS